MRYKDEQGLRAGGQVLLVIYVWFRIVAAARKLENTESHTLLGGGLAAPRRASTATTVAGNTPETTPLLSAPIWASSRAGRRAVPTLLPSLHGDAGNIAAVGVSFVTLKDPNTALTALGDRERCNDGTTSRLDGSEFKEGACLGANNLELLDATEAVEKDIPECVLAHVLSNTLQKKQDRINTCPLPVGKQDSL